MVETSDSETIYSESEISEDESNHVSDLDFIDDFDVVLTLVMNLVMNFKIISVLFSFL